MVRLLEDEEMRRCVLPAVLLLCLGRAHASDHSKNYMVGVIADQRSGQVGSVQSCASGKCVTTPVYSTSFYIKTNLGVFRSGPPVKMGLLSGPVYLPFFVSHLHQGDKVIFAASCGRNNGCDFWFPDPDKRGKEIHTIGDFHPDRPESNTQSLCGTGKLPPAVASEMCQPDASAQQSDR